MSKDKSYGARFLYSEDLLHDGAYRTATVEIEEFIPGNTLESADGRRIDKPTLKFKGKEKMLVLCKTNSSILHFVTGNQPGPKWVGFVVRLEARFIEAFGDTVPAIRVMPPSGCKIRKGLVKGLGKKAEWVSPINQKEAVDAGQH